MSGSEIDLGWTAATDNVGVTNYMVERCQGVGCATFAQIGTSTTTQFNNTGLSAGSSDSYRVRATDASGNLGPYSNTATTTTPAIPAGLVAAYSFNEGSGTTVTDLSGNNLTGTIVGATWTTGGKYGNGLSFDGAGSYVDLGNPSALQLTGSMTIEAWINAAANPADDGQIVAKSDSAGGWQFKTSPDTGPHTFGVAVSGSTGAHTQRYSTTVRALNTWYHVAGVYDAAAGTLSTYVNGVLDNGTLRGSVPASQLNQNVNVNIGRRTGGSGYYFNGLIDEVRIYNRALSQAEIQSDMSTPLGAAPPPDTVPPTAPSALAATALSSSQINLSWTASTDNVGVTQYRIESCSGAGCSTFTQIGTATGTTFSNTGLSAGTSYSYRVRASDAAGNLSGYSNVASATTNSAADTQPPTAPSNLAATAISTSQINLSWTASTDNVGVTNYLIEQCVTASCTFAQIGTSTGTTFNSTGLTAGTGYSYRVRATDAANNLSPYSNTASATTNSASDTQAPTAPSNLAATAISTSQINLSWTASTDNVGVTNYLIEQCVAASCTFAQIGTSTGTTFNSTGLTAGTGYSYRVRATDAANNLSAYSNTANATTQSAVAGLVAAYGFEEGIGTTVADLSGNGNNGTLVNATWTASGKFGKALVFNGTNAEVTIPDAASLHLTSAMTLEAWVNPSTVSAKWRDVIYKGGNDNYLLEGTTTRSGGAPGGGATIGSTDLVLNNTAALAANTWAHLAVTYDGTTMRFYVNGTQVSSQGITGSIITSATPLQIGGDTFYSQYFAGTIDEVRVYNVALTATQIQADMGVQVGPPDTQAPTAPSTLTATAVSGTQINLSLDRFHRQCWRIAVPDRELLGNGMFHVYSDRYGHRYDFQ